MAVFRLHSLATRRVPRRLEKEKRKVNKEERAYEWTDPRFFIVLGVSLIFGGLLALGTTPQTRERKRWEKEGKGFFDDWTFESPLLGNHLTADQLPSQANQRGQDASLPLFAHNLAQCWQIIKDILALPNSMDTPNAN